MTREEAIEIVRKHGISADGTKFESALRELIPELRESEDERIRKCIGMALTDVDEQRFKNFRTTLKDCLSWLEKQKEQKPEEWSKEDEARLNEVIETLNIVQENRVRTVRTHYSKAAIDIDISWLKSLRPQPKPEWSEEDKPVEFPSSKYTLELKITEFQGQVDTTYVLIPKEK